MKSDRQICGALGTAFLYPREGPSPETHVVCVVLFLIGRFILAAWLVPLVMITGMGVDSGTDLAFKGTIALMYAMSLLVWAALLWSWRCAAASGCLLVSIFLLLNAFEGNDQVQWLLAPVLIILCVGITEALPAPIRTTWRFQEWCNTNDDEIEVVNNSEKEMSPLA
jgi:hypothetical protein